MAKSPLTLEVATLFLCSSPTPFSEKLFQQLKNNPPLKITSRMAWFLYKRGETETASQFLLSCADDDPLANWLRFRLAQRDGNLTATTQHLRKWMKEIETSDRIFFQFGYNTVKLEGVLGALLVTQKQLSDALVCFVEADSYPDAALITEVYLETNTLKAFVDTLQNSSIGTRLRHLLARRLFREGRLDEALPYYSPETAEWAKTYRTALALSRRKTLRPQTRSAHLFHAARILRWHGSKLCATALAPDYAIYGELYDYWGNENEKIKNLIDCFQKNSATPLKRHHYRYRAAELAGQAAELTWNFHQRATILWVGGNWIKYKNPKMADPYYKRLARTRFDSLGKVADQLRWFPPGTPALNHIYGSSDYIDPATLAQAAKTYEKPQEK